MRQVYNSYGQLDNAALLARYGFAHEGNPLDQVPPLTSYCSPLYVLL